MEQATEGVDYHSAGEEIPRWFFIVLALGLSVVGWTLAVLMMALPGQHATVRHTGVPDAGVRPAPAPLGLPSAESTGVGR